MLAQNLRILVIDDDEDDFVLIRELFDSIGHSRAKVEWAPGYAEGRERLLKRQYDVYLIDYRLGEKSGLDLLSEAIAAGVTEPIFLLTGYGDRDVDLKAMEMGAADYLVKDSLSATLLDRSIRYGISHAQAIENLKQRELDFRNLLNASFEGIFIHQDGQIIEVNEPGAALFGFHRDEIIGRNIQDFLDADDRPVFLANSRSGRETHYEILGIRKDGKAIDLEVLGKDYFYRGEKRRMTAMRDISARKQMEATLLQQDRLASIGLLASSMAHEIGNPLGVIRGRAEFIQMRAKDDEVIRKYAEVIHSQIDRVSRLIRSLLKLARGEHESATSGVSLSVVVSEVLDLIAHDAEKKGIAVRNDVPLIAEAAVKAEAQSLHQVVLNLLINAIHAVESEMKLGERKKGHFIRISLEDLGDDWALCVQDTGTGISEKNMKQLFQPFFTTKQVGEGTGLGLATSYRIIESWGGKIQVESKEGEGALFRVLLPKNSVEESKS